MAFREVGVVEIREVLRLRALGKGYRKVAELTGVDRKTVRRYVDAAGAAGLLPGASPEAITDELIGQIVDAVRPVRPDGHGTTWGLLCGERAWLKERVDADLKLTKIQDLFERRSGVLVPYATLHRFAVAELEFGRHRTTLPIADGEPGSELQVDFGRMGLLLDSVTGRRRVCHALIFTAVYSRHQFLWITFSQRLQDVIEGFEAAWAFFGGVFAVIIPDNLKAIVSKADSIAPIFNEGFVEYAQSRGFVIDPARVRKPRDKARVERNVSYVRHSFFAGEDFKSRDDAQERAERWCLERAGMRIHGTTARRPREVFDAEERSHLLPAPDQPYDLPVYARAKVHRDHHIEVARALYSVPGGLIGEHVDVRADAKLVRISHRGRTVKTHPRMHAGGRSTDADDLPAERSIYALRDIDRLIALASTHGPAIGTYASRLLDCELPWTKMRQTYRLLGLVRRFGAERVETACAQALDLDVVDVTRIARMVERGLESSAHQVSTTPAPPPMEPRFARPASEFGAAGGER